MNATSQKFDLITIGDSTIDTFIKIHDANIECDINRQECKICLSYGSKIPVDSIAHGPAGNAANVAVACSKLGLKCAIYTNLGDDDHGKAIHQSFTNAAVALDYIKINPGKSSNLSVVLTFQGERTIFVYHQDWSYQLPQMQPTTWLYLTSVAQSFTDSSLMDEVCHYVDRTGAKLAFAPGTFQLKADIKRYPRVLEKCQILIVNYQEAKKILGIDLAQETDVHDLFSKLLALGPKIIVITDGEEGSYATDGAKSLKIGAIPTQIVERTGAGDAYASGLITALSLGLSLEEAMIWGTINAAFVIRQIGAQNGLLNRQDLEKFRKESKLHSVSF